ncbi:hypothetical protein PPSIR1_14595 [Plesiocystis pacifica SIR-1]|uniref:Uncharacterized protein n=1 Tax=Plesiocystis pacifica SIR-1 TaxID=391625 RepID=A6GFB2_9BACT|nr:hypothetical protein [Plesiocystis pacifica]EDM75453.1 hypothetical protein PPSIR1_14595 [Plesiocystis pacifica SIR-1]
MSSSSFTGMLEVMNPRASTSSQRSFLAAISSAFGDRARHFGAALGLGALTCISACAPDEGPPRCDDFDHGIELEAASGLSPQDFEVVCDTQWTAAMAAWAPAESRLVPPAHAGLSLHPQGGYLVDFGSDHPSSALSEWFGMFEAVGSTDPSEARTLRVDGDIAAQWSSPAERIRVDGQGQLWGVDAGHPPGAEGTLDIELEAASLVQIDAETGAITAGSAWSFPPGAQDLDLVAAAEGEPGLWFTLRTEGGASERLYRLSSLDEDPAIIVERPTPNTDLISGWMSVQPLPDGGVAWGRGRGMLDVHAADGALRWTFEAPVEELERASVPILAANADGQGAIAWAVGGRLYLRGVDMVDGSTTWERDYARYAIAPGELCTEAPGCGLVQWPSGIVASPNGGFVLVSMDGFPSHDCAFQPLVLELDGAGEGIRGHRVGTCGTAAPVGYDASGALVIDGQATEDGEGADRFLIRLEP